MSLRRPRLAFALCILVSAAFLRPARADAPPNVILVTLDGVRTEEIFPAAGSPDLIPEFRRAVEDHGKFFGDRDAPMRIANRSGLSLPGYRALLSGTFELACRTNSCRRIRRSTLLDRLVREPGFGRTDVAAFASWERLHRALEGKRKRAVRSAGADGIDGLTESELGGFREVLDRSTLDIPPRWEECRWDRYTFDLGIEYLVRFRPRFLYLSFVDTDEFAHQGDRAGYENALRAWDERFAKLVATLAASGDYGANTSIVVTTDHGRGRGSDWGKHGRKVPGSERVWAAVLPSSNAIRRGLRFSPPPAPTSHLAIRPTVETLLGLPPSLPGAWIQVRTDE